MKKQLNQLIFKSGDVMKERVRVQLEQIVAEFVEYLKIKLVISDIIVVGSIVNYNYNAKSDIDLHIVVDFSKMIHEEHFDILKEFFVSKKRLWNSERHIFIKGIPVEIYVQDVLEEVSSNGIYSVKRDKWVKKPIIVNQSSIIGKSNKSERVKEVINMYNTILHNIMNNQHSLTKLIKNKEYIFDLRNTGLHIKNDEYGVENILFKKLRNNGIIKKLNNLIIKLSDKKLSLESKEY